MRSHRSTDGYRRGSGKRLLQRWGCFDVVQVHAHEEHSVVTIRAQLLERCLLRVAHVSGVSVLRASRFAAFAEDGRVLVEHKNGNISYLRFDVVIASDGPRTCRHRFGAGVYCSHHTRQWVSPMA